MRYRILLVTLLATVMTLGLVSCSEEGSSQEAGWYNRNTLYSYSGNQGNLWDRMRRDLRMPNYTYTRQVRTEIRWYQAHQSYLNHVIAESAPYIYYIYQQTQKHHLPAELALIPVIESEYNPYARSRVGALGLWQMMPGTARGFGLKRDRWYDGRKDIYASTNAALEYFRYLHSLFHGDWLLAIAAYDCGEGTVMSAIRYNQYHHRSGDFWNLPLSHETRSYVPRLLAVAAIIKSPRRYGINLAPIDDAPYIAQVNIGSPIDLNKAAKLAQVPLSTMKVLNPALQHGTTDPRGPYTLVVPHDKANSFQEKLAMLTNNEKLLLQSNVEKSRESIEKMTKKYHSNITLLKNNTVLAANENTMTDAGGQSAGENTPPVSIPVTYEVQNEDDLQKIAHKFHTTPEDIRKANSLSSNKIKVGQVLNIPSTTLRTHHKIYIVRKGDYIERIAKRMGVSVKDLRKWNNPLSDRNLKPGQKIIIAQN